jgi:uncharacterized membrane protein
MIILDVDVSDWFLFFGRFHPLLVHFPIGFLTVVIVLELLRLYEKIIIHRDIIQLLLMISAISAVFSCIAGYFLSLDGGYDENLLNEHRNQGIFLAILTTFAWLMKVDWFSKKLSRYNVLYFPTLLLIFFVLLITGHHGGSLTHGETYLTEKIPQPFRKWMGMSEKNENYKKPRLANVNDALVYQEIIQPIFKKKCETCHNPSKMKGDLRMDTFEFLKKGGEHGKIFVEGKAEESELIERILLPESDENHMPPKGKTQIDENEIVLLKWWIDNGASENKKVSELPQNKEVKSVLASLGGGNAEAFQEDKFDIEEKILKQEVEPLSEEAKNEITKVGGLILPLSQENHYIEMSFINHPSLNDETSKVLLKASKQTVWLRLSHTKITDITLKEVGKLTNLTRLHLENTKITDKGLENLKTLQNLEYLNMIGTSVSDMGLKNLSSLKNLKKIYLWQTKTTEKGIAELQKTLPKTIINKGISEPEMKKILDTKNNEISDDVYDKK